MNTEAIIERVKNSFCNLTKFKVRENALEVITAYSTINNKFVSVFVSFTKDKIVLSDSGWISQNYYDTPVFEESEEIIKRVTFSYIAALNVKSTHDKSGTEYFYKTCKSVDEIPSTVFDLANFIVGVVNASCIQFKDEKEEKERDAFRSNANGFLKANYNEKVKLRIPLDDLKTVKFSAIVEQHSNLFLINYVTGSTQQYFENDLRKTIVNFEISEKSKYKELIKEKICLINDQSEGYQPDKSSSIFELLSERSTKPAIKWSEKERILEFVN